MDCRCSCGQAVKGKRVFVNKEHQLQWMVNGGAAELNRLQPIEAKQLGGRIMGNEAYRSGRLAQAGQLGAERSREIADRFRHGMTGAGP